MAETVNFSSVKETLTGLLLAKGIEHRVWDDAISIPFTDGFDDEWIYEDQLDLTINAKDLAQESLDTYCYVSESRERIIMALRHSAMAYRMHLDRRTTGKWCVYSMSGVECEIDVDANLTLSIKENGEIEAFRKLLKEGFSYMGAAHLLQGVIKVGILIWRKKYFRALKATVTGFFKGLWKVITKLFRYPPRPTWSDRRLEKWLNKYSEAPKNELTWEEYKALTNEDEEEDDDVIDLADSFPEIEKAIEGAVDVLSEPHKEVMLPCLEAASFGDIDKAAAAIVQKLKNKIVKKGHFYKVMDEFYYQPNSDTWLDRDWLISTARSIIDKSDKEGDFGDLRALELLVYLGEKDAYGPLEKMVSDWYDDGGHDMCDERKLLNMFPHHRATKEMLETKDQDPEKVISSRSYHLRDMKSVLTAFRDEKEKRKGHAYSPGTNEIFEDFDADHWSAQLDDVLDSVNRLSAKWAQILIDGDDRENLYTACMEATELPTGQLRFIHERILITASRFGWIDVAKSLRNKPAYPSLLFGKAVSGYELWKAVTSGEGAKPDHCHDMHEFAKPLLQWSLLCPDEKTKQYAYTAMLAVQKGRADLDDQLAAAVAWIRCNS